MSTKSPDVSVIILNYKTRDLVRLCLESIGRSKLGAYSVETIVCDNDSGDGTGEMIAKEFPGVVFIQNGGNVGFAAGNNPGIRTAKGRYVLLLNSDTEVSPDALSVMVAYMDAHADVGAATCKLVLQDGSMDPACHRGEPTPWAALTYYAGLEKLFPNSTLFARYHQTYKDLKTIHDVDIISGAFLLVRRGVVDKVGLLDEDYFMYGEDMDWCMRIRRAGFRIVYNPETTVLHKKKQSGRAHKDRKRRSVTERWFFEYNKLFYRKNYDAVYPRPVMALVYFLFDLRLWAMDRLGI